MLRRTLITGALLTWGAFAQMSSFPKPSYFRETFQQTQTKVVLKDPVRLKDFVVGGNIELSLKDYLALTMANNTGIQLQMLSVEQPKNAIQRAFDVWDPRLTATFNSQRSTSLPTSLLEGAGASGTLTTLSQPFSSNYTQTLDTGTQLQVQYAAQKISSSNSFSTFNPSLTSNLSVNFTQPLIQNRGRYVNRLNLMMARSSYRISDYNLRSQLLTLVNGAETAYWNVIQARESVKVAEKARETSQSNLNYVQQQLDLGAISPLDIYNPQQQLASTVLQVSQAKFALAQAEDALRLQIAVDLDADLRKLPINLTETVDLPNVDAIVFDREESINKALAGRPDVKSALQSLDRDDLAIQQAKNGMLPNLALLGTYQSQGRGGVFYQRSNVSIDGVQSSGIISTPGGFGDALDQMFHFGFPVYSFGLRLNLPVRSHAAAANMADALIGKKTDALRLRNTQEGVRLSILNAITALEGSKEQLKLAKIQQDFAQKNLDAMKEKYQLGAEILQNVITAEVNLSTAESNVVQQQVAVRRNILNLLTQTGELLDERGIVVQ
jgi:outer membrane protein